jgi:hypothetical protein
LIASRALKSLPEEIQSKEDRLRRFVLEAKAASALNQPQYHKRIHEIGNSASFHVHCN